MPSDQAGVNGDLPAAYYQQMIDSITEYEVIRLDEKGIISSWHPGAERLTQYTADQILGKPVTVFYTADDVAEGRAEVEMQTAAETGRFDAFVALGVVIRGETYHFEVVANESARAIMALTLDGLAIGNGILTVENEAQALARARRDEKDKGGEAAKAALVMMALKERFAN